MLLHGKEGKQEDAYIHKNDIHKDDEDDDTQIARFACVYRNSRIPLKLRREPLGLCVGTYGPLECPGEFLKPS